MFEPGRGIGIRAERQPLALQQADHLSLGHVGGPVEGHMLDIMGKAALAVSLVQRACIEGEADFGSALRGAIGPDRPEQPVGQPAPADRGIGFQIAAGQRRFGLGVSAAIDGGSGFGWRSNRRVRRQRRGAARQQGNGQRACQSFGQPIGQSLGQSTGRPIGQHAVQPWPIAGAINQARPPGTSPAYRRFRRCFAVVLFPFNYRGAALISFPATCDDG
jgi:hypothetical protein